MFKFKPIDINKLPIKNLMIVCMAVISIVSIRQCSQKTLEIESNNGDWKFKYAMMKDSFNTTINAQGEMIAFQDQMIVDERAGKELLKQENSELKELASHVKVHTNTVIKEVYVPLERETVSAREVEFDSTIVGDSVEIRKFMIGDEWYGIKGRITPNAIAFDSVSFKEELTTNIGWKRDKWYKSKYAVIEVKSANPYTKVEGLQNVVVKEKKKLYQTMGFKVGIGILTGMYINNRLSR
jgi:hypothetical protein